MRRLYRSRASGRVLPLLVIACAASPTSAQERVSIEQVQVRAQRSGSANPAAGIQESDYLLATQSGSALLSPGYPVPSSSAASNQARALQLGSGNASTIDQTGYANIAIQNVVGAQNSVTQSQSGDRNQSTVSVIGNSNVIGTQQDGSRASVTITVNGNNNAIATQQSPSDTAAITVTRTGNGNGIPMTISRR